MRKSLLYFASGCRSYGQRMLSPAVVKLLTSPQRAVKSTDQEAIRHLFVHLYEIACMHLIEKPLIFPIQALVINRRL